MTAGEIHLDSRRHLPLEGTFNTRDLGGYATTGDRSTKWGRYLRSDSLHNLTAAAVDTLIEYGVRSVVDLRRSSDLQFKPSPFIGCRAVVYYHQNMTGDVRLEGRDKLAGIDDTAARRGHLYCLILEQRKHILHQIMSIFAQEGSLPALVHCNAGKDRAGIIAAFVLDIAGVARATILEDYALSARYNVRGYLERNPGLSPEEFTWETYLDLACPPGALERTLDHLDEKYGGVEGYLHDVGITDEQIEAIRSAMVE